MAKFTKIPKSTFDNLQLDAGILLNTFNPEQPTEPEDSAILCATTGGITISAAAEYSDMGEDVDNCPVGMMELKKLVSWLCTVAFSSITFSPEMLKLGLGAADIADQKVTLRRDLQMEDFADIWWVGDLADGGMVAVHLMNALSTEGIEITTSKNGKGTIGMTLQGHVSMEAQDTMPMEFYVAAGA